VVTYFKESKLNKVLLSTAYFPPIAWFSQLVKYQFAHIEAHENYVKQSYRNRCLIYSSSGPLPLIIPTKHSDENHIGIRDVEIDFKTKWNLIHLKSIKSSYSKSPFFIYYVDEIALILENPSTSLFTLNSQLIKVICSFLKVQAPEYTHEFKKIIPDSYDLRYTLHPKQIEPNYNSLPPYYQVFSDKHGFYSNLSILDLIFNLGPEASIYLKMISQ